MKLLFRFVVVVLGIDRYREVADNIAGNLEMALDLFDHAAFAVVNNDSVTPGRVVVDRVRELF